VRVVHTLESTVGVLVTPLTSVRVNILVSTVRVPNTLVSTVGVVNLLESTVVVS
jgi:hypothetical protein